MSERDLIEKVAELWDRNGGDAKSFLSCAKMIAEEIDEIQSGPKNEIIASLLRGRKYG